MNIPYKSRTHERSDADPDASGERTFGRIADLLTADLDLAILLGSKEQEGCFYEKFCGFIKIIR